MKKLINTERSTWYLDLYTSPKEDEMLTLPLPPPPPLSIM